MVQLTSSEPFRLFYLWQHVTLQFWILLYMYYLRIGLRNTDIFELFKSTPNTF